jgi:hypothetical protein
MAAVHPIREAELQELLRSTRASRDVVDTLVNEGRLEAVTYGGERFYRTLGRRRKANRTPVAC